MAPNRVLLRRNIAMDYSDATAARGRGGWPASAVRRSEMAELGALDRHRIGHHRGLIEGEASTSRIMSPWMASISACKSSSAWIEFGGAGRLGDLQQPFQRPQLADAVVGLAVAQQARRSPSRTTTQPSGPSRAGRCSGRRTSSARRRDRRRRRDAPAPPRPCRCRAFDLGRRRQLGRERLPHREQMLGEVGGDLLAQRFRAPRCSDAPRWSRRSPPAAAASRRTRRP